MLRFFTLGILFLFWGYYAIAQETSARTVEEAFKEGYLNGHFGTYAQQASHKEPTFVDLNMSLAYQTLRYRGYKIGAEAWLNAKIFEQNFGGFDRNKDIFILTNLYGDFYNQYEKFGIRVGRYHINEEWITHNTEGFSVDYDGLQNISLHFTWAFRNAYTETYYNSGFRSMYRVVGSMLVRGELDVPNFPLKITPYFYFAPGVFFASALKTSLDLPLLETLNLRSNAQFLSYIQDKGWYGPDAGAGFLLMMDSSVYWNGLEGGVGLSVTDSAGASRIDAFGQHTVFERPVGMFWGDAVTIYGFARYDIGFIQTQGAVRNTFIEGKNIFNWEAKLSGNPLQNFKGLELGIAAIGMDNQSNAVDYFGGNKYILVRGYVQYKF